MITAAVLRTEPLASFWAGRRVALTGGSGFVGYHIAHLLAQNGARVRAILRPTSTQDHLRGAGVVCETAPLDDVAGLVRACRDCEYVFHIAGTVDFTGDWQRLRQVNAIGSANVLAAARAAGV